MSQDVIAEVQRTAELVSRPDLPALPLSEIVASIAHITELSHLMISDIRVAAAYCAAIIAICAEPLSHAACCCVTIGANVVKVLYDCFGYHARHFKPDDAVVAASALRCMLMSSEANVRAFTTLGPLDALCVCAILNMNSPRFAARLCNIVTTCVSVDGTATAAVVQSGLAQCVFVAMDAHVSDDDVQRCGSAAVALLLEARHRPQPLITATAASKPAKGLRRSMRPQPVPVPEPLPVTVNVLGCVVLMLLAKLPKEERCRAAKGNLLDGPAVAVLTEAQEIISAMSCTTVCTCVSSS